MNFLSHYYFERYTSDSYQVLGSLLPDLLKNVDKRYSFQIQKYEPQLHFHHGAVALTKGWMRHLEVDRVFHNSDFFYQHTHQLRLEIAPIIEDLPIRASFLAHIGLELLLDHLLIDKELISVSRMYEHLENVDRLILKKYLSTLGIVDSERFFIFFERFLASKYIFEYAKVDNLPHALYNICKRLWKFEVSAHHIDDLALKLNDYKSNHLNHFLNIYNQIQQQLD